MYDVLLYKFFVLVKTEENKSTKTNNVFLKETIEKYCDENKNRHIDHVTKRQKCCKVTVGAFCGILTFGRNLQRYYKCCIIQLSLPTSQTTTFLHSS